MFRTSQTGKDEKVVGECCTRGTKETPSVLSENSQGTRECSAPDKGDNPFEKDGWRRND